MTCPLRELKRTLLLSPFHALIHTISFHLTPLYLIAFSPSFLPSLTHSFDSGCTFTRFEIVIHTDSFQIIYPLLNATRLSFFALLRW